MYKYKCNYFTHFSSLLTLSFESLEYFSNNFITNFKLIHTFFNHRIIQAYLIAVAKYFFSFLFLFLLIYLSQGVFDKTADITYG